MNYERHLREKITKLRMERNLSEYQLSTDIGRSKTYIQAISSGKTLPSFSAFFDLCDYFDMTPAEFFAESDISTQQRCIQKKISKLSAKDMQLLDQLIDRVFANALEEADS